MKKLTLLALLLATSSQATVYNWSMESSKRYFADSPDEITDLLVLFPEVLKDSDALVLLTEWKEFRSPDFEEIKTQLKTPVIFDGRNQYNAFNLELKGFEYYQIGKK